jgi:hypothetical protein
LKEADEWRQPIKIIQVKSGKELFVQHQERAMLVDYKRDTAVILVTTKAVTDGGLALPDEMLPLFPSDKYKIVAASLAWAGYPAIAPKTLCLFQGGVSAFNTDNDSYYIDGIAINGVSGGPVFEEVEGEKKYPRIVGIVSAYHYNRQGGGNLPGLLMAHDATHLNKTVEDMKNLDDARKKAAEDAKKQQTSPTAGPTEPEPARKEASTPQPGPSEPATGSGASPSPESGATEPPKRRKGGGLRRKRPV